MQAVRYNIIQNKRHSEYPKSERRTLYILRYLHSWTSLGTLQAHPYVMWYFAGAAGRPLALCSCSCGSLQLGLVVLNVLPDAAVLIQYYLRFVVPLSIYYLHACVTLQPWGAAVRPDLLCRPIACATLKT